MKNEVLLSLILKIVNDRLNKELEGRPLIAGRRGPRGPTGEDGKDFVFSEHESTIKDWINDASLKFSDLTDEQKESLKGIPGRAGRDGRDFVFEDHADKIKEWVKDSALKFSDLTEEELAQLRGPTGRSGKDGKPGEDGHDFLFEEHQEKIQELVYSYFSEIQNDLKLKFTDLTDDEKNQLRGPRGQRGRAGQDFDFEQHREFFQGLKPKFSDFTEEEIDQIKFKFKDFSLEEIENLKLKFSDLSDEERQSLRGPRGQRGMRGMTGAKGDHGPRGPQGLPGQSLAGPRGYAGIDGLDGKNGKDAPRIIDVDIRQDGKYFYFIFTFSDGKELSTSEVKIPSSEIVYIAGGGGGFSTPPVTPPSSQSQLILDVACEPDVYIGAVVRMKINTPEVMSVMADWFLLNSIVSMDYSIYDSVASNALADAYENSNVLGMVESKSSIGFCDIRTFGPSANIFVGLDITEEYYLSDVTPGGIVKTPGAPTTSGSVLVRVGQPASQTSFVFSRGDRMVRI